MSTILLCKSENNMNINNNNLFQASSNHLKEIEQETIRLKREEGGGSIIIQAMAQPQQQIQQQQPMEVRQLDHDEKKMRRQIANSNERRRMQSINAGFQSLRQLLPHHEGEKLSKAAILQQTAEYIDRLELEKQQLQAQLQGQNQHLQRLADSAGGANNNNNNNECPPQQQQLTSSPSSANGAIKKRKLDQVITLQTISDSSDEGLGSMSPEPVSQMIFAAGNSHGTVTKTHLISATTSVTTINVKDYVNLQNQMETERRHRQQLERELKQLEMQFYTSEHYHNPQKYHQIHHQEVIEHEDEQQQQQQQHDDIQHAGHVAEEKIIMRGSGPILSSTADDVHYVHPQYIVVNTPSTSPQHLIVNDDDDNSRTLSSDELHKDDVKVIQKVHIPSILEQAIKAEPKVEVERINSPCVVVQMPMGDEMHGSSSPAHNNAMRTTYPNCSHRPNLETIVEAIRHLEGDNFDIDEEQTMKCHQQPQDAPLALTTSSKYAKESQQPFKFQHNATSPAGLPTFSLRVPSQQQQQQQQTIQIQQYQRPGVIVVKQSS